MSNIEISTKRLPTQKPEPVYITCRVAADQLGVNWHTFDKYAEPAAWRKDHDGKLHALYAESAIDDFRREYRDGRVKTSAGAL